MASRTSQSSLLGPPTTVAEDEDSMVGALPSFHDENRPNWNYLRRSNDATTGESIDAFELSPPVHRAIKDFNAEMDALTRSFDDILLRRKKQEHSPIETNSVSTPYFMPDVGPTRKATPLRQKEPPTSAERISPLRSYSHSTPVKRSGSASHTPSEPPPAPMETPVPSAFTVPTPNQYRNRRGGAPRASDESCSHRSSQPVSTNRRGQNRDAQTKMDELKEIIREQQDRIQDLEIENEILRKRLHLQPSRNEREDPSNSVDDHRLRRQDSGTFAESRSRLQPPVMDPPLVMDDGSIAREEPEGHHQTPQMQAQSPYRGSHISTPSRSRAEGPPRHIQTISEKYLGQFTPGARFVAELSMLMHIENTHYVPLSMIIDKHWDKLRHHFHEDDHDRKLFEERRG